MEKKKAIGRYVAAVGSFGFALGLLVGSVSGQYLPLISAIIMFVVFIIFYLSGGNEGRKLMLK